MKVSKKVFITVLIVIMGAIYMKNKNNQTDEKISKLCNFAKSSNHIDNVKKFISSDKDLNDRFSNTMGLKYGNEIKYSYGYTRLSISKRASICTVTTTENGEIIKVKIL